MICVVTLVTIGTINVRNFFFFNRHCNPYGLWPAQLSLNILCRKVFTECRCQRHVKPPNMENQWLERSNVLPGVPHVWNDASEPQQRKVELWVRNFREFCRKWRLPRHFWVLLDAEGRPEKSGGFGRVWTLELGYQRPARSPPRPPKPLLMYVTVPVNWYICQILSENDTRRRI